MVSSVFPPVHFPLQMFATPQRLSSPHKPINDYGYDHLNIYRFRHTPMNYSFHQHHRQSSPLKVIQLVEVPAPSKPERVAPPPSSSASSSTSESSSEDEPCTSYCSSDDDELPQQRAQFQPQMPQYQQRRYAESENVDRNMSTLMLRIEAWRDEYAKAVGAQFGSSTSQSSRLLPNHTPSHVFGHSSSRITLLTLPVLHFLSVFLFILLFADLIFRFSQLPRLCVLSAKAPKMMATTKMTTIQSVTLYIFSQAR